MHHNGLSKFVSRNYLHLQAQNFPDVFDAIVRVKGPIETPCDERYKSLGFETLNDLASTFFYGNVISEE